MTPQKTYTSQKKTRLKNVSYGCIGAFALLGLNSSQAEYLKECRIYIPGNLYEARAAGFNNCIEYISTTHCQRQKNFAIFGAMPDDTFINYEKETRNLPISNYKTPPQYERINFEFKASERSKLETNLLRSGWKLTRANSYSLYKSEHHKFEFLMHNKHVIMRLAQPE